MELIVFLKRIKIVYWNSFIKNINGDNNKRMKIVY
jgi:hypothetical protein